MIMLLNATHRNVLPAALDNTNILCLCPKEERQFSWLRVIGDNDIRLQTRSTVWTYEGSCPIVNVYLLRSIKSISEKGCVIKWPHIHLPVRWSLFDFVIFC